MDLTERIARSVPATVPRDVTVIPESRRGNIRHAVLNYHEIVANRFVNVPVHCDALSIVSTFPVLVRVDDETITNETDTRQIDITGTKGPATWAPGYDTGSFFADLLLLPTTALTVRRRVARLSITAKDFGGDFAAGILPGACHVWLGTADTDEMTFGLPVSYCPGRTVIGLGGVMQTTQAVPLFLHGGGFSPVSGRFYLPSRIELWGIIVRPQWSAGAGVISQVRINQLAAPPNVFNLAMYFPGVLNFDYDFGNTIEVPGWQTEAWNADGRGVIQVIVDATQPMSAITVVFRAKGYM